MVDQTDALRDRYSALSDDELRNLAVTAGLLDNARELLDQELRHRGITDSREYREHLERFDRERLERSQQALERKKKTIRRYVRTGYAISLFGILMGLFVRYGQRDERNGIGIIIACIILLPLVWIIGQVRLLIWRLLLRP